MTAYKHLSEYYSDNGKRRASVSFDLEAKHYRCTVVSESGSAFTSIFETEDLAEQFAESWVVE